MNEPLNSLQLAEALTNLRRNLQPMLDLQTLIAEVRWHSYHEHIKAGFTEAQALELCKHTMMK